MNPFKSGAKLGKHGQTGGKFGTKTVFPYLYRIFRRFSLCTLSIEYQQHLTLRGICNPTHWSIRICNSKKQFLFAGHTHTTVFESPCGLADSEIRSSCCTGLQIRRSVCLRNNPSVFHAAASRIDGYQKILTAEKEDILTWQSKISYLPI